MRLIYILHSELDFVKQADIAKFMKRSRASVCRAVYLLKEDNLISLDDKLNVTLTAKCKQIAIKVIERYKFFKDFLLSVGVDEVNAENDACNLEHAICTDSFEQLKVFVTNNGKVMENNTRVCNT